MPVDEPLRAPMIRHGRAAGVAGAVDLSERDRELIRALQEDGRRSFAELARRLGSNATTIARRVGELRERHVIEITTVADPRALGYGAAALIGIRLDAATRPSETARDLFAVAAVDYVVACTGRYDLLVEVLCRDVATLAEVVESEIRARPGVREAEVFPYVQLPYQQPAWDAAQGSGIAGGLGPASQPLNALDRSIVDELNRDGRVPFSHVAARLGISEAQVRKRYAQLTASGAVRVMALTKPSSIGFDTMAWIAVVPAPGARVREVAARLAALPSVAYLAVCTGRFDVLAEVVCRDPADLLDLLDRDIRSLDGVARVEALQCLELFYRPVSPVAPD